MALDSLCLSLCLVMCCINMRCPQHENVHGGECMTGFTHWCDITSKIKVSKISFSPSLCRRLDANHITTVPEDSFEGLQQLRHLWLDDNSLTEVPVGPMRHQANLQALTLALNRITHIPNNAFANLSSLVVL